MLFNLFIESMKSQNNTNNVVIIIMIMKSQNVRAAGVEDQGPGQEPELRAGVEQEHQGPARGAAHCQAQDAAVRRHCQVRKRKTNASYVQQQLL